MRLASLLAIACRPIKANTPKHHPTRSLVYNTPVGVVRTIMGSTVAVDTASVDQPTTGVRIAAGELQPATEEEAAPAKNARDSILRM